MTRPAYSAISSYSRVQVLHMLQERPQRTIAELCQTTGLHANTVREHLQRLIDSGYVVAEPEKRTTRGRPRVLYSAASADQGGRSPIALRKAREAAVRGDLMRRIMPWTDTGAEGLPTDAVHQLDALVDDLGEAGFDPVIDETTLTVDLSPCPHASSTAQARTTLCSVHLGLMEGVLSQAGGPLHVAEMAPSCDPARCVVHLAR
ncbi:MAG: helix-turn-helix domain-containing protein [Microbacterium sp.]|uniref:helix-turn-helix transcriptional regulator n=1 Tax=Microbacterium sp. TaxID=51671 RepID=UPI002603B9DD|nr:helix-turn-helix domain-containing protein [Microbacterium sp.]MCX6502771.1 helix-turn-helix domain-containing protein [Microbacterium sp.]